jgi:hypothetical protein
MHIRSVLRDSYFAYYICGAYVKVGVWLNLWPVYSLQTQDG